MKEFNFEPLIETNKKIYIEKIYKKNEIIFQENEICNYICFVKKGSIIISSYSSFGNEIIYSKITKNNLFGNNLIFSSEPKYLGNVIAEEDSIIYLIKKDDFINLLTNNIHFLEYYLSFQSEYSKEKNSKIKMLSMQNAEERFIYYLSINNNTIIFKSVSSLANTLNLRRETLSRLISYLEEKKVIIRSKNTINLYKEY